MSIRRTSIRDATLPPEVLAVLRAAVSNHLQRDSESLAAGLQGAGWQREAAGGWWSAPLASGWTLISFQRSLHIGLFANGEKHVITGAKHLLADHLDRGEAGELIPDDPDPDWTCWHNDDVSVYLTVHTFPKPLPPGGLRELSDPRSLQLDVARSDEPSDGFPPDPQWVRHLARHGTVVQRWHLAAQEDLPDDVVQLLTDDPDPSVITALRLAADARDSYRRQQAHESGETTCDM